MPFYRPYLALFQAPWLFLFRPCRMSEYPKGILASRCSCQNRGQGEALPQEKGGEQYAKAGNPHAVSDVVQQQRVGHGKLQRIDDDAPGDPEKGKAHEETKAGLLREEDRHIAPEDDETNHGAGTAQRCLHSGIEMRRYHRSQQQQDHQEPRGEHVPALQSPPVTLRSTKRAQENKQVPDGLPNVPEPEGIEGPIQKNIAYQSDKAA